MKCEVKADNICHNSLQIYSRSAINMALRFLAGGAKRNTITYRIQSP